MSVFLTRLKEHFTTSDKPNLFSDEIYTTGSQFIMANYDILLRTYKLMSKNMDSDMEEWIYRSSYNAWFTNAVPTPAITIDFKPHKAF